MFNALKSLLCALAASQPSRSDEEPVADETSHLTSVPCELDAEALRHVSGGASADVTSLPKRGW